jgi:hypothetical protein
MSAKIAATTPPAEPTIASSPEQSMSPIEKNLTFVKNTAFWGRNPQKAPLKRILRKNYLVPDISVA